ncbi:MAG TPA: hypothetical protein VMZ73_07260 [Acidimicrobiales bacterium]|nr:hypothetical protein [Acidimicrobiales bacterium]
MRRGVRMSQALVVITLALAGVGVGHVGEYVLLAPEDHARHELLASTGHHYLPFVLNAVAFVALLGLALVFVLGVGRGLGPAGRRGRALRWPSFLPAAQMLAFVALEVGERLLADAPLTDLGVVLAIGVPLQAIVGFLAGRLAAELEEAGERLGQRLREATLHPRRTASPCWRPNASLRHGALLSAAPIPARGPPVVLVSA